MDASIWVPLVTAAAGLIAGLATGLVSTVLTRRWAREDRAEQWQREDALRWQQDRLQVYTRMISALDGWDAEAHKAIKQWQADPPSFDAGEWERHDGTVKELLAQLRLVAPQEVSDSARRCYVRFGQLRLSYLDAKNADLSKISAAGNEPARETRRLRDAMRADLGLSDDGQPAAGAEPRPGGRG